MYLLNIQGPACMCFYGRGSCRLFAPSKCFLPHEPDLLTLSVVQLEALSGPSHHVRMRDLEGQLFRLQQQLASLQGELDASRTEVQRLEAELQEREEELMGAEGKIAVLRKEVHRLTSLDHSGEI